LQSTVSSLTTTLENSIDLAGGSSPNDVFVFQLWDNTLHAAWAEGTVAIPHTCDSGGRYHVHGDAILIPAASQVEVFKTLLPLLKCAEWHGSVMLGPLPRYLYKGIELTFCRGCLRPLFPVRPALQ
jgi:hypothetical protein